MELDSDETAGADRPRRCFAETGAIDGLPPCEALGALKASEARLKATLDGVRDAIITVDETGRIQSLNKAARTMFGYEPGEVIGRDAVLLLPDGERRKYAIYMEKCLRRGALEVLGAGRETQGRRKDGSLFPAEVKISDARYEGRRLFVGFVRDMTERRRIEAKMQKLRAERLNAIGEMATALAHEINQPLSATGSYLKAARRLAQTPPERRVADLEDTLDKAAAQIMRAGHIVAHLREFITRGEPDKTLQSLHDLVLEVRDLMLAAAKRAGVRVILLLSAEDDLVLADRVQIKQILINLVRNAIEAMSLSARRELTIATSDREEDMVEISVADTGPGLSEEVKAELFEPFVTTKADGMGVGLSISRSIILAHYGRIWADSRPGGGAVFSFTLPLAQAEIDQ